MFTMANSRAPGERRAELIRVLLQRGADVNARNAKGQTTFMYACIMNQVKPLKVLLEQVRSVIIHTNTTIIEEFLIKSEDTLVKKQQNQQQQPKITFTNNRQKPTNHGHCNFKINYYEHVPFFDWTYRRYTNFFR